MKALLRAGCWSALMILLAAGCGAGLTTPEDDQREYPAPQTDGGKSDSAGDSSDSGTTTTEPPEPVDAGSDAGGEPPVDPPPPGPDAGQPPPPEPDAGLPPEPDAGQPPEPDAGQPPEPDAGQPPEPDAGQPPAPDAGQPPEPDAGQPPKPDAGQPPPPAHGISINGPLRGVNLSSAEWGVGSDGSGALPGKAGTSYVWPDPAYASGYTGADYFVRKGMNVFRLPFRWERLQPRRNQPFDSAELGRLRTTVGGLLRRGAYVILDPHNYARYGSSLIGSSAVPDSDFADFWFRLAGEYKSDAKVIFNLMNEPYGLPTEQWVRSANAAIDAIRRAGAANLILAPGNAWTGAHSWYQNWYGTANAVAMLAIRDPLDNTAFEVHQYLDSNAGGTNSSCVSTTAGSSAMRQFTGWLRANGKKGFLGEFAGGSSGTCQAAVRDLVQYLQTNKDVYIGWTYWAGGPWWGSSWYSLEPSGSSDKPMMGVLAPFL